MRLAIKNAIDRKLNKIVYWYVGGWAFSNYLMELISELKTLDNFIILLKNQLYKANKYYNKNIIFIDGFEKKYFIPECYSNIMTKTLCMLMSRSLVYSSKR